MPLTSFTQALQLIGMATPRSTRFAVLLTAAVLVAALAIGCSDNSPEAQQAFDSSGEDGVGSDVLGDASQGSDISDAGSLPSGLAADPDAPPITASPGTALHHAQTCAQYLGPIPAMSCADAELMPITVDGVEVLDTPASCDRPSALTGTCETGERIAARYTGTHHDGSPRPEVVFVNFCRDGGMGVIGHNSETGATCFFHISMAFPNDARHPGSDDPNYDSFWQSADVVAADNCQGCHQADPWLHSPWIDQLRDPADPSLPLVPLNASLDSPYIVVGEGFAQPHQDGAPENSCTSCHRAQCDTRFAVPLGELAMPAPFADSTFTNGESADLQELRDWCATLPEGPQSTGDGASCEAALEGCVFGCVSDADCAQRCADTHLDGERAAALQSLVACMAVAGCGFNESCLDDACGAEFGVFDGLCG